MPLSISSRLATRLMLPCSLLVALAASACSDASTAPSSSATDAARKPKSPPPPTADTTTTTTATPAAGGTVSVLVGAALYVDPNSSAKQTADSWRLTRPADATQMDKVAAQAQAKWFGNWNSNISSDVSATVTTARSAGKVPVLVAYNIPQRDCGGLSGGNATAAADYQTWINGFASGLGHRRAVVVLEPDALAGMDCLSSADQQTRVSLLTFAVKAFRALDSVSVYIDAGNPRWQSATTMAGRLQQADIAEATGFSLNISNFYYDSDNIGYGQQISSLVGGRHFVIDSSRNGLGPTADNQWCNPDGRALGTRPSTVTAVSGLDAYLWIKNPGESDGACNGAPSAGTWMPDYALGLAQRAAY